jgi:hypothetical protein
MNLDVICYSITCINYFSILEYGYDHLILVVNYSHSIYTRKPPALTQKFPKFFNNFLLPIIIVILLLIAGQANVYMMNLQGKNLGFMIEDQFSEAKSAGIFNREKWIEIKAKQDESIKLADKQATAATLEKITKTTSKVRLIVSTRVVVST